VPVLPKIAKVQQVHARIHPPGRALTVEGVKEQQRRQGVDKIRQFEDALASIASALSTVARRRGVALALRG